MIQEDRVDKNSPSFAPGAPKLPNTPLAFVAYFLKVFYKPIVLMFALEIAQKTCEILIPYAVKNILDTAISLKSPENALQNIGLKDAIVFFVFISLGTVLFSRTSGAILVLTGPQLRRYVRKVLYHFMQHHSQKYFSNHFAGSLANRINEVSMSVNHGLWTVLFDFWPTIISFSVSLYLLYTAHFSLALYLGVWILFYVSISLVLAKRCNEYSQKFAAARSKTTGHIVDAVTNILNTKLFAKNSYERDRLDKQLSHEVKTAQSTFWFMEKMRWFQFLFAFILQVGLIVYAIQLFTQKELSVGSFTMVASLGLLIINDAKGLSRRFLEFFEYMGNINDGVDILVKSHDIVDLPNASELSVSEGSIQFENVSFSYAEGKEVFKDLDLKIQKGEKVGLVGFSGSGKTTFVNLILRMYDIDQGKILIDDQDIRFATQNSLRRQVSMIPQEPMLFHRSLLENIRYGQPDASEESVILAAKQAHAHEFIHQIKDKYEALVGERGIKLSGGQRQRIAVARAFLKNAPILIMDEATSSLDSVTEKLIQDSLDDLMKDKTVLVIAHRLSTLAKLDRILVFDQGRVIEDGTHEELLKKEGHYALLWNMQINGFLPEEHAQSMYTGRDLET